MRKKSFLVVVLLLVGLVSLIGCSNGDDNGDLINGESTLTVKVEDDASNSLEAEVTILQDGAEVASDQGSEVQFTLNNGDYEVEAEKDGYVGEPKQVKLKEDKVITIELSEVENMLGNGDFSSDVYLKDEVEEEGAGNFKTEDNWVFLENTGTGSVEVEEEMVKLDIDKSGDVSYAVQLLQAPITLEKGYKYKVKFDAKASKARDLEVKIGGTADRGWSAYNSGEGNSGGTLFNLSDKVETYESEFVMGEETDDQARFEFQLGIDDATIWLDNVELVKLGKADEDEMPDDDEPDTEWVYDGDFFFIFNVAVGGLWPGEPDETTEFPQQMKVDYIEVHQEDELVWEDRFQGSNINEDDWTYEVGNGHEQGIPGWGNEELEYYTDGDNAEIVDDKLVITAEEEEISDEYGEYNYTSTRMITGAKANLDKPGRVEIRAKLPEGQGIWPALWMLGDNINDGVEWPECGEIDIMELVGDKPKTTHGTVHGPGHYGGGGIGNSYELDSGKFSDEFHTFILEWEEDELRWYVDDEEEPFHAVRKTAEGGVEAIDADEIVEEPEVDVATGDEDSEYYFMADDSTLVDATIGTDNNAYDGDIVLDSWGTGAPIAQDAEYNNKNAWELTAANGWDQGAAVIALMGDLYDTDADPADFPADLSTYDSLEISLATTGGFSDVTLKFAGPEKEVSLLDYGFDPAATGWQTISIPLADFAEIDLSTVTQIGLIASGGEVDVDNLYVTDFYLKAN